jgi:hypothetical protein
MATYTKSVLSGSTDGKPIQITGTASGSANTLHIAHATGLDEIWLWANNVDAVSRDVTLEWGGNTDAEKLTFAIAPGEGSFLIVPGWIMTGSQVIKAFASVASKINFMGFINRIV